MGLFTEQIHYLKTKVFNYPKESVNWLVNSMAKPTAKFMKLSPAYLKVGSFFFSKYDMQGVNKSSKMEQFVPMMVVDYKPQIDSKVIWVINLNFLTMKTKEIFFSSFMDRNNATMERNKEKEKYLEESPIPNVSYKSIYSDLLQYGFEYSIREMRLELFNEIYGVSTDDVHKLITINTQAITGVDEGKLNDIWIAKLKSESFENRVEEILAVKNNYDKIVEELSVKFKELNKKLNE